jgi:hypothetical protein
MAHFARMDSNNVVMDVIVLTNMVVNNLPFPDSEPPGVYFCQSLYGSDTTWLQTSYNGNFRVNYAGIGYSYDADLDAFIPPQPYPSWVLDSATCQWVAPIPMPTDPLSDGEQYIWDEAIGNWVIIPAPI